MTRLYVLTMDCVSGDEVQVAIHRREDIAGWVKKLDHEGSSWDVCSYYIDSPLEEGNDWQDMTVEIMKELENV